MKSLLVLLISLGLASLANADVKKVDQIMRNGGWSLKSVSTNSQSCDRFVHVVYGHDKGVYQVIFIDPSTGWGDWSEQGLELGNDTYTVVIGDEQMSMTVTEKSRFRTKVIGTQTLKVVVDPEGNPQLEYSQFNAKGKIKEKCTYQ